MVRCRNTNGMVVPLLFLTAILIDTTPETRNYSKALVLHHLKSKLDLHATARHEESNFFQTYILPIITTNGEFHRHSVNLAILASLFLFIYYPSIIPSSHFPPACIPGYPKTPAKRFTQARDDMISFRFVFEKLLSCFIHRDSNRSSAINLIITFITDNISSQSARGPPGHSD
jgi:hypothetical protein